MFYPSPSRETVPGLTEMPTRQHHSGFSAVPISSPFEAEHALTIRTSDSGDDVDSRGYYSGSPFANYLASGSMDGRTDRAATTEAHVYPATARRESSRSILRKPVPRGITERGETAYISYGADKERQTHGLEEASTERQRTKAREPISWWWWWEIGAVVLSAVSMGLVLLVLLTVNNRPLQAWGLPIQPNSLIAVFTTIGKTAMLVPVAAALSQLKWRHFHSRPQQLVHLQLFDDASRGPWGSFMMLLNVRTRAVLAWGFALVTVAALGIEPSAQQILEFTSQDIVDDGLKVEIASTDSYTSRAFANSGYCKHHSSRSQSSVSASHANC